MQAVSLPFKVIFAWLLRGALMRWHDELRHVRHHPLTTRIACGIMCSVKRLRRSMDRTKVSGTLDVGSIPAGAIDRKISQVTSQLLRDFYLSGLMWQC